ncbi:MAG TPA: transglutaminase-like domain-containing protein [Micromonosporaceae bacterium]
MSIDDYARQSSCSDPRAYAHLFDKLPTDIREMTAVVRNLILHYRAGGVPLEPQRIAEIDHRWMDRLLETDQRRFDAPLEQPRPLEQRVAGCCRDFSLLTVAALRHRGVPARTRIGFAGYFAPPWHHDHVIVDYWDGERWVFTDPELEPAEPWSFDPGDMPRGFGAPTEPFVTAAQVWTAYRRGDIDPETYGVDASLPFRGPWFIRNYVVNEVAHRQRDELLLWDVWGAMSLELDGDLDLIDRAAALLLAADLGDEGAERDLTDLYAADVRLRPGAEIMSMSPTEHRFRVDLAARTSIPA